MRKNSYIRYVDPRIKRAVRRDFKIDKAILTRLFFSILFIAVPLLVAGAVAAFAEDGGAELNENISSILEGLDLSGLQEYLDEYGNEYVFSFSRSAKELIGFVINGDLGVDYGEYLKNIFSALFSGVTSLLPAFSQIVAVTILCAVSTDSEGGIISKSTAKVIRLACISIVLLILASMLVGIAGATAECVTNIKKQIDLIAPILITLTVLTGGSDSGAIYTPCAIFLGEGAVYLVNSVILPMTLAVIVLNFMSKLNPEISFTGVAALLKTIMKWIIGITVAVFGLFITVQSSATSLFNGIFFKVTKYLVGNSVPIVGNFLSAGVDMIVLSGTVVKSGIGMTGVILLIGEVVAPVTSLIAFSLMLKITGAIAQPIGEKTMYSLFSDLSKDVEYLIAGILTVTFLYLLVIMLIINSAYAFI